jgi:hypothetical protein
MLLINMKVVFDLRYLKLKKDTFYDIVRLLTFPVRFEIIQKMTNEAIYVFFTSTSHTKVNRNVPNSFVTLHKVVLLND